MSLFIGKTSNQTSLITTSTSKQQIRRIFFEGFLPKIGQLKLVAHPNKQPINGLVYNSLGYYELDSADQTMFDGWVYADGSRYSKASFAEAYSSFLDKDENSFVVPNLDGFLKNNNYASQYQDLDSNIPLLQHSHSIDTTTTGTQQGIIRSAFQVFVTPNPSSTGLMFRPTHKAKQPDQVVVNSGTIDNIMSPTGAYHDFLPVFHRGGVTDGNIDKGEVFTADLTLNFGQNFGSLNVNYYGDSNEIYPAHIRIGLMVYIGVYKY